MRKAWVRTWGRMLALFTVAVWGSAQESWGQETAPATVKAAAATMPADMPKLQSLDEVVAGLEHRDVRGKVVDQAGKPVSGAEVFLYYFHGSSRSVRNRLVGKTTSDANGVFGFDKALVWEPTKLQRGGDSREYAVAVRHKEHGLEFATILKGDTGDDVVVQMEQPATKKLTIVDEAGAPVEGAKVYAARGMHTEALGKTLEAQRQGIDIGQDIGLSSGLTDAKGEVEIAVFPRDTLCRVVKSGYAHGYADDKTTKTTLCKSARVYGQVTFPDGSPAAGMAVEYGYTGESLGDGDVTLTDQEGKYEFKDVAAKGFRWGDMTAESQKNAKMSGSVRAVDLRAGSYWLGKKEIFPVNPGDNIAKNLVLQRGGVLSGRVTDVTTGKPAVGVMLDRYMSIPKLNYFDSATAKTDADGKFQVMVAPGSEVQLQWNEARDGSYVIDNEWRQNNHWQAMEKKVVNTDLTGLELQVKLWVLGELKGKVVDAQGAAVKGAEVYMHPHVPMLKSDQEGLFTLRAAPQDREFDLYVQTKDQTQAVLTHCNRGTKEVTLPLAPTKDYEGRVVSTDGSPAGDLKFIMVMLLTGTNHYQVQVELTTDAKGKFTAKHLLPGAKYNIFWSADNEANRDYDDGYAEVDLSTVKESEPIRFQAKRFINTILGQVVNEKGEPIAGAVVSGGQSDLLPQNVRYNNEGSKPCMTDKKGEFTLDRLAAGELEVTITAKGYKNRTIRTATDNVDFKAVLKPKGDKTVTSVTVVDEEDKPLAGAKVSLVQWQFDKGSSKWNKSVKEMPTNAAGQVIWDLPSNPPEANTQSMVYCDIAGRDLAFRNVPREEDAEIRLAAPTSGATWQGVVVDGENRPITGAKVAITGVWGTVDDWRSRVALENQFDDNEEDPFHLMITTDAQGKFQVARFSPKCLVEVEIKAPGYAKSQTYFDPREAKDKAEGGKKFTLAPGVSVKGRVVFKGTNALPPLHGKVGLILQSLNHGPHHVFKVADDGTFQDDTVAVSSYRVYVNLRDKEDRKYVSPEPVTVETQTGKTTEVVVTLEEGIALRGKMVGEKEWENLDVLAAKKDDPQTRAWAQVEKDGTWVMYLPKEGEYELSWNSYENQRQQTKSIKTVTAVKNQPLEEVIATIDAKTETDEKK